MSSATTLRSCFDALELTALAWHDCIEDVTPPDTVIDDIFTVARGDVTGGSGANEPCHPRKSSNFQ